MPGSLAREQSGQATVANTFTAGVDVGGSKLHGVLLDSTGTVRSRLRHQMPTGGGNTIVEAAILALLDELLAQAAALDCYPAAIGLGAPGFVDSGEGTIVDASNLHVRRLNI